MHGKKTVRRGKKIALAVIIVILIVLSGVVVSNFNNISALYKGLTQSSDEISSNIEKNKQNTSQALQDAGINMSEEDFEKLNSGELSADEILQIIQGAVSSDNQQKDPENEPSPEQKPQGNETDEKKDEYVAAPEQKPEQNPEQNIQVQPDDSQGDVQKPVEQEKTDTPPQSQPNPVVPPEQSETVLAEAEYNKKVADLVAKVYTIKSEFMATLDSFESKIVSEYKALPAEQRTSATKAKIVADNMSYMLSLEAQCDAQIKAVTDELTKLMKEYGKDMALVDAINSAYANEKELKKAYYVSLYK